MCFMCDMANKTDEPTSGLAANPMVATAIEGIAGVAEGEGWDYRPVVIGLYGRPAPDDTRYFELSTTPLAELRVGEEGIARAVNEAAMEIAVRTVFNAETPSGGEGRLLGLFLVFEAYQRDIPPEERDSMPPPAEDPRSVEVRYTWFMGKDGSESYCLQKRGETERTFAPGTPGDGAVKQSLALMLVSLLAVEKRRLKTV